MTKKQYSDLQDAYEGFHTLETGSPIQKDGSNVYTGSTYPVDDLLAQQQKIIEITKEESTRLDRIKAERDSNLDKMDLIRKTEFSKRGKYTWLLAIFAMVGIIGLGFLYVQNVLGYKSVWFDIMVIVLVAALLITAIIVSLDVQDRDPNDFSKLKPNSDKLINMDDKNKEASSTHGITSGNSDTDMTQSGCEGPECCGDGTTWDDSTKKCVDVS
jgi:hypothetical protein